MMKKQLPRILLGLILLPFTGCMSVPPAKALKSDTEFLARFDASKVSAKVVMLPIEAKYSETTTENGLEERGTYQPPLATGPLTSQFQETLQRLFKSPLSLVEVRKTKAENRLAKLFLEAENRGAELILRLQVTENVLSHQGLNKLAWFFDLLVGTGAPPFHWWIPDEEFRLQRSLVISLYDVRDSTQPLYKKSVTGQATKTFNEFQHSIVFLNPLLALWKDPQERFELENWQRVYTALESHSQQDLLRRMLSELGSSLSAQLQSPALRERIRRGDPKKARLYAVFVGQNNAQCKFAENDAKAMAQLFKEKFQLNDNYSHTFIGDIDPALVLSTIENLKTKSVDRVLFYFSGRGKQQASGQSLVFSKGRSLRLKALARSCEAFSAKNTAFILDTSFGDTVRAQRPGGRTDKDSLAELPEASRERYLSPLSNVEKGWQVFCPSRHSEATGEYRRHGILTHLMLNELEKDAGAKTLGTLITAIQDDYIRRARVLLGGLHNPLLLPRNDRQPFSFQTRLKTPKASSRES